MKQSYAETDPAKENGEISDSSIMSERPGDNNNISSNMRILMTGRNEEADFIYRKGLAVPCSGFYICIFIIDEFNGLPANYKTRTVQLTLESSLQRFSDLRKIFVRCGFFNKSVTALFSMPPVQNPAVESANVVRAAKKFVKDNLGIELFSVMSAYIPSADSIYKAYAEAWKKINLIKIKGTDHNLIFIRGTEDAYAAQRDSGFIFQLQYLCSVITAGDCDGIIAAVEDIAKKHLETIEDDYPLLSSRINIISGVMSEYIRGNIYLGNTGYYVRRFDNTETISGLTELTREAIAAIKQNSSAGGPAMPLDRAVSVINGHYSDCGLDVESLSAIVDISKQHLERLFKAKLGTSVSIYINKFRIEKSKYLLENSDKSIIEIAEDVGYTNNHSFARNFKKFEGILPSAYRSIHRSGTAAEN